MKNQFDRLERSGYFSLRVRMRVAWIIALFVSPMVHLSAAPLPTASSEQALKVLDAFAVAKQNAGRATADPQLIENISLAAYVWGLAPEFVYRWSQYQQRLTSPTNELTYGRNPAAWNNRGNTNAGNPSVLYLNAVLDLSSKDLVLTIPPTEPPTYLIAQVFDNFINTISAPGTGSTPSGKAVSYLLVGPKSRYARKAIVRIKGLEFPVIALDTPHGNLTVRVKTNPLSPASSGDSTTAIYANIVQKFALNKLSDFLRSRGPVFPKSYSVLAPTDAAKQSAIAWARIPNSGIGFFEQVGESLRRNRLPNRKTGLSGLSLSQLPPWLVPQPFARTTYFVPSADQKPTLDLFKPIGLSFNKFKAPAAWDNQQLAAMERGFQEGVNLVNQIVGNSKGTSKTNYWQYLNQGIGSYSNNAVGYLYRALTVVAGGFANIPEDALYAQINTTDGLDELDGNNIYSLTFLPPANSYSDLPVTGILPPLKISTPSGSPSGFWSLAVYQTDATQSSAPYISQVSTTNTAYTQADGASIPTRVVRCNADNSLTVEPSAWTNLVLSSALVFGKSASSCGLSSGLPYFVATVPVIEESTGFATFKLSTQWRNKVVDGTPIPNTGEAGPTLSIVPSSQNLPSYAALQPVSQIGSAQITDNQLAANPDGSFTIWLAPPEMAAGRWEPARLPEAYKPIPSSNWIPTPSTSYLESVYGSGQSFNTSIRPMIRLYDPMPGNQPPSLLPCPAGESPLCPNTLSTSYVLPRLVPVMKVGRHQQKP